MGSETLLCAERDSDVETQAFEEPIPPTMSAGLLSSLLSSPAGQPVRDAIHGVVVGELLALADDAFTPLVMFAGQSVPGAVRARSIVELRGAHIGRQVVLMFDSGDPGSPIVMGLLQGGKSLPGDAARESVEIDSDGERLLVSARDRLELRCGKARITLTKAGKVLIEGAYVLSRSTGVNRIKGGSVQLN